MENISLIAYSKLLGSTSVSGMAQAVGLRWPPPPTISVREMIKLLSGTFMPGSPIAALNAFTGEVPEVDVFSVGVDGRLWQFRESNDTGWSSAFVPDPVAAPGAPLAATLFGVDGIEVLTTGNGDTTVSVVIADPYWASTASSQGVPTGAWIDYTNGLVWVDATGSLQASDFEFDFSTAPGVITPAGFAPAGAPLAVGQRLLDEGTYPIDGPYGVFCVGNDRRLHSFFVDDNTWVDTPLPGDIDLAPGSFVATGYQTAPVRLLLETEHDGYSQLDVFVIDPAGQLHIWYSSQNADWQHVAMPAGAGLSPGASIGIGYQGWHATEFSGQPPFPRQLDVFTVDPGGLLRIFYNYDSRGFEAGLLPQGVRLPPGAHIATANQQFSQKTWEFHQLDAFVVDITGRIQVFWESYEGNWAQEIMPGS